VLLDGLVDAGRRFVLTDVRQQQRHRSEWPATPSRSLSARFFHSSRYRLFQSMGVIETLPESWLGITDSAVGHRQLRISVEWYLNQSHCATELFNVRVRT
jgi:hypothetical protein